MAMSGELGCARGGGSARRRPRSRHNRLPEVVGRCARGADGCCEFGRDWVWSLYGKHGSGLFEPATGDASVNPLKQVGDVGDADGPLLDVAVHSPAAKTDLDRPMPQRPV